MKTIKYAVLGLLCACSAGAADIGSLSFKLAVLDPAVAGSIEVRVTTTNESDHPITYYNTNLCNYSFKIVTATGTVVPETEERKRLNCGSQGGIEISGRRILVTLKPGESSSEDLRLPNYNDISQPGEYSVRLSGHSVTSAISALTL
jgi:hypothetical protein